MTGGKLETAIDLNSLCSPKEISYTLARQVVAVELAIYFLLAAVVISGSHVIAAVARSIRMIPPAVAAGELAAVRRVALQRALVASQV